MKHTIRAALFLACLVGVAAGCEKVNHKNIDKWERTEKGPGKLRAALSGGDAPDLRAHAAQILIRIGEQEAVLAVLEKDAAAEAIMTELFPRLWKDAEVIGGYSVRPDGTQIAAKDSLVDLRRFANDATRTQIDARLVEWLTGGIYEGRARTGRHSGRRIIREIGQGAGPALVRAAQGVIAKPPGPNGGVELLGDELLLSLAFSGHPAALSLLLDLVEAEPKEPTLPTRAMNALFKAYVDPDAGIDKADGKFLQEIAPRIGTILRTKGGRLANDAADLLVAMGMPGCLPPFVELASSNDEAYRFTGSQKGIRCGGVDAIAPITKALPTSISYEREILNKYLWREILALPAQKVVAERARDLLLAEGWVARVTGLELLGALARKDSAEADAELVDKLKGDRTKLRGWWGKAEKKPDPTLGAVAQEVASKLRAL